MSQSSEDLFALVDHVPTPIFILDVREGGVPVYAHYNTSALSKVGRELSEFVGKTVIEAFGEQYGTAAYNEQRKTIMGRKTRKYEFQMPVGNEIRVIRTTLCPQLDSSGKVIRLIGSASDVSLEWIAQSTASTLENIGSEVEQFVAMAAHDLRTPMRNVSVLAEMLLEDFEDHGDGKIDLIKMLRDTSEKSMKLISDILSYASSFGRSVEPALYRLDLLAADIMQSLDSRGQHHLKTTGITLSGEKNITQIVLRNLIDNALKHGKRDHMRLSCDARMINAGTVEITLSDDGAGFSNPGTVFLDTGDFRVDSGYGLLAIRKMIKARGGDISAGNDPKTGGSRVSFTLPHSRVTARSGAIEMALAENRAAPSSEISRNVAGL